MTSTFVYIRFSLALIIGIAVMAFLLPSVATAATDLPVKKAELTAAPLVPLPITRDYPAKVLINLDTIEIQAG